MTREDQVGERAGEMFWKEGGTYTLRLSPEKKLWKYSLLKVDEYMKFQYLFPPSWSKNFSF